MNKKSWKERKKLKRNKEKGKVKDVEDKPIKTKSNTSGDYLIHYYTP